MLVYQAEGDAFFVPLYGLPETRETVVKYIPDHQNWAGFEKESWSKIPEAEKLSVLGELGDCPVFPALLKNRVDQSGQGAVKARFEKDGSTARRTPVDLWHSIVHRRSLFL